jgi:dihydropteroate synthase
MSFKDTLLPISNIIQSKGKLMDLAIPKVMGIINATPDSFYGNSRVDSTNIALDRASEMITDGAHFLDIGGYSTKPHAEKVSEQEEMDRVLPVIEAIANAFPEVWISVDTFCSKVAAEAILKGANIVNDISGVQYDEAMLKVVSEANVPYILMHLEGDFDGMHKIYPYENDDVTAHLIQYFRKKVYACYAAGIKDVILDPGFGFSKSISNNYDLLSNMASLRMLGLPILAGISRKSMIYKTLHIDAPNALNGTTALHMVALQQGASILRVHDVKEAHQAIQLFEILK